MSSLQEAFQLFQKQTEELQSSYLSLQNAFLEMKEQQAGVQASLKFLFNSIHDGILYIDENKEINLINNIAASFFGQTAASMQSQPYYLFFTENELGFSIDDAEKQKKSQRILTQLNGKHVELSCSHIPQKGLFIWIKDITDQKKLEQVYTRSEKLVELGEMAASLAHEIRNPLGGVMGFASLLHRELNSSPHLQEMTRTILEGTKIINRLVTSVLEFANPLDVRLNHIELKSLLKDCCSLTEAAFPHLRPIDLSISEEPIELLTDKQLLGQALLNLLKNAYEADKNPLVEVSMKQIEKEVFIEVKDNGPGIEQELKEKIFLPFFTTKTKGTGLGLSETHKIVTALGGNLILGSSGSKGSLFIIRIPHGN